MPGPQPIPRTWLVLGRQDSWVVQGILGQATTTPVEHRWNLGLGSTLDQEEDLKAANLLPSPQPQVYSLDQSFTATLGLTLQVVHKIVFWIFT